MPLWQTILGLAACVSVLVAIPVVLMVVFGRRRQRVEAFVSDAWTATVVSFEYEQLRYKPHNFSTPWSTEPPFCIVVRYRREDGTEGAFRVAGELGSQLLVQSTLQPLPPPGLYQEIDERWEEGSMIQKRAGEYYPELVGLGRGAMALRLGV